MLEVLRTLAKGGPVMVPLAVCSVLAVTVIIERYFALRHADRGGAELMLSIRRAYRRGDGAESLVECEQTGGPVANVLAAGLRAQVADNMIWLTDLAIEVERASDGRTGRVYRDALDRGGGHARVPQRVRGARRDRHGVVGLGA